MTVDKELILTPEEVTLFESYFYSLRKYVGSNFEAEYLNDGKFSHILGVCTNTKNKNVVKYFIGYMKFCGVEVLYDKNKKTISIPKIQYGDAYAYGLNKKLYDGSSDGVEVDEDFFFATNIGRLTFVKFIISNYSVYNNLSIEQ